MDMSRDTDYGLIASLARTDEAGGLAKERAVLLLWFFRHSVGLDDLDAYDYVCDGDKDAGIDGLYLEQSALGEAGNTLVIFQSKYSEGPTELGPRAVKEFAGVAHHFTDVQSLRDLIAQGVEPRLMGLIGELELERKLADGWLSDGRLRIRLALVTTSHQGTPAKNVVTAMNREKGPGYLTVYDIDWLGPLARAVASRSLLRGTISIEARKTDLIVFGQPPNRVVITAVRANDVAAWPGIDDRTLFDLNVRRELRPNPVRQELDRAIRTPADHPNFLAYHNGLTVVCESLQMHRGRLVVRNPSVVNGAQSVIAFRRGLTEDVLSEKLRVATKFVEVGNRPQLSREVSRRSNTQNPVNPRMLMANSGPQTRLEMEFKAEYPDVAYLTKPDYSHHPSGAVVIENDLVAQLLCAVQNARPWLAVKRTALFESENHALIFNESVHAAHVLMCHLAGAAIDSKKTEFPEVYRSSWRLTRIVAAYLVGQMLRAGREDGFSDYLEAPQLVLRDRPKVMGELERLAAFAAATLKMRRVAKERDGLVDDYNREFKNEDCLGELGTKSQEVMSLAATLGPTLGLA
ncbi:MAG: AIPR family protein [Candidatus Limnocylindrales bacterium]